MKDNNLPEFIGSPVQVNELQINVPYAMVFTPNLRDPAGETRELRFHAMLFVPSVHILQTVMLEAPDLVAIAFVTVEYWDEHVWTVRSLITDGVFTVERETCEIIENNRVN